MVLAIPSVSINPGILLQIGIEPAGSVSWHEIGLGPSSGRCWRNRVFDPNRSQLNDLLSRFHWPASRPRRLYLTCSGAPPARPGSLLPIENKPDLFIRFRGTGEKSILRHVLPPLCDLQQGPLTRSPLTDHVTSYHL